MMEKLKVATFCSGVGSPEQALKNLKVPHEIVFYSEIDKFASQTYEANHGAVRALGDMSGQSFKDPSLYADLVIAGLPCQSFSLAGLRQGEDDDRGILFYDFYHYVRQQRPKMLILENVKGLLSMDGGGVFQTWTSLLGKTLNGQPIKEPTSMSLGYALHSAVLNTKDFGVPQNRERVFLIGIREDLPDTFAFPSKTPLTKRLRDLMEPASEVSADRYLGEEKLAWIASHRAKRESAGRFPYTGDDISGCITARMTKRGAEEPYVQDERGIRLLTTTECARLQGFPSDFKWPVSDTQKYKQLGNTITVDVIEAVLLNLLFGDDLM